MAIQDVLKNIDGNFDEALERLFELLRIPSISTDPAYAVDCARAADWLVNELEGLGFSAKAHETPGHPMVVGHHNGAGPGAKRLLFYAHYDVQPVDPLDLWESDPFDPRVTEAGGVARIVGRGTSDDKGQMMTFVEAVRATLAAEGELPVNVTVLFEGEEESGSPSLVPFLKAHAEELASDVALICDTGMWDPTTPSITTRLRGMVGQEVTVKAADMDLHSGMFGGAARNPIHVLAKILAGLHDETGRVTLPGFYDGVSDISPELRANWDRLGFDETAFLGAVGLSVPAGETGRTVLEKIWARPTAEVNGISGGYTGEGFKTVLPSEARAKISFRLVGDQDPQKVEEAFQAYVRAALPADCSVTFSSRGGSPAVQLADDSPALAKARAALTEEWGKETAITGSGGSIPVAGYFNLMLGMDTLMIGFGLDDDRIHSPNEKYDVTSFHKGTRSWARIIAALGA
jgi:acetylornithine deacetylase/succinyl-diaminopimelate desuccinylase-like protein